jgi:hypothetical protein
MKRDKYMGMDVHQATSVVVVLDTEGKLVLETIVATEAAAVIRLVQGVSGPLHVTLEETTQAAWLYEVIRPHVAELVVCDPRRNKLLGEGSKADKPDARKLAELLRAGMLRSVYHGHESTRTLKELVRAYETLSLDTVRTMVRIKALYRGSWNPNTRSWSLPTDATRPMVGPDDRTGTPAESRIALRGTGSSSSVAEASPKGDARRKPETSSDRSSANDSRTWSDSMRLNCGHCGYPAPFPKQTPTLELHRVGGDHAYELGI